ncbi:hypothetical protein GGR54DRAFT_643085 [Hypoxylon sp. NC1633]|nr:hypothetical protein GGR54DRAFT_643085 [Hypoxylon sp. NC1633]
MRASRTAIWLCWWLDTHVGSSSRGTPDAERRRAYHVEAASPTSSMDFGIHGRMDRTELVLELQRDPQSPFARDWMAAIFVRFHRLRDVLPRRVLVIRADG